jgi:hypothetical protein
LSQNGYGDIIDARFKEFEKIASSKLKGIQKACEVEVQKNSKSPKLKGINAVKRPCLAASTRLLIFIELTLGHLR